MFIHILLNRAVQNVFLYTIKGKVLCVLGTGEPQKKTKNINISVQNLTEISIIFQFILIFWNCSYSLQQQALNSSSCKSCTETLNISILQTTKPITTKP